MSKSYNKIRQDYHQYLKNKKIVQELFSFFSGINKLNDPIEIEEKNQNAKLKKVSLINCNDTIAPNKASRNEQKEGIERIWRINLEQSVGGFTTGEKTTEIALLILKKKEAEYKLYVIFIELKSTLKIKEAPKPKRDKKRSNSKLSSKNSRANLQSNSQKETPPKAGELRSIADKFKGSMNRMYMLLTLNNHKNSDMGFQNDKISIDFKGLVFYNTKLIDESKLENKRDRQMYRILKKEERLLSCDTILDAKDKITIAFIQNKEPKSEEIEIEFQEILEQLNII